MPKNTSPGLDPVGKTFDRGKQHFEIVGLVADTRYRNMREPITPTAFIPMRTAPDTGWDAATFLVKTVSTNPMALAGTLRKEVPRARGEFRVSNVRTQVEIDDAQTVRERLLAMLALFFAGVGLLLAGVGLYGVLDYSVLQRRREFAIRMAVGAPIRDIARRVTVDVFAMVLVGSAAGASAGLLLEPTVKSLLYQVAPFDFRVMGWPFCIIVTAALLAAVPAILRALRIDAAAMLRVE